MAKAGHCDRSLPLGGAEDDFGLRQSPSTHTHTKTKKNDNKPRKTDDNRDLKSSKIGADRASSKATGLFLMK